MRTSAEVDIDACPDHVWAVLTDVSRWPVWSGAVREVRLLDGPALGPGSVVRVAAQGLPDRTWRVSGYTRHRSFTWTCDGLGSHAELRFRLRRTDPATSRPTTRLCVGHERRGWLAGVVDVATANSDTRQLERLTQDLKTHCEQRRPIATRPSA